MNKFVESFPALQKISHPSDGDVGVEIGHIEGGQIGEHLKTSFLTPIREGAKVLQHPIGDLPNPLKVQAHE